MMICPESDLESGQRKMMLGSNGRKKPEYKFPVFLWQCPEKEDSCISLAQRDENVERATVKCIN